MTDSKLLIEIVRGKFEALELVRFQVMNIGLSVKDGQWLGFRQAKEIYQSTLKPHQEMNTVELYNYNKKMRSFHSIGRLIKFLLDLYMALFTVLFIIAAVRWFWNGNS
jgi:hypothetical protein